MKPVQPSLGDNRSAALAFLNRRTDGTPTRVSIVLRDAGLTSTSGYKVQEMFDGLNLGIFHPDNTLTVVVNPSGNENFKMFKNSKIVFVLKCY